MPLGSANNTTEVSLRVLICDDESLAREYLRLVLSRISGVEVVSDADSAVDCIKKVSDHHPDVVFLDINLPDSSGITVAEALNRLSNPPVIVFVTGYDDYAITAFQLAATDYVMKPYDQERLEETIRRIKSNKREELESTTADTFSRLPIKDKDSLKLIKHSDILYICTEGRKTSIHTKDSIYLTQYTIADLALKLEHQGFFRANEGCLVNLEFVKEVLYTGPRTYELLLDDSKKPLIPLSRSRAQRLKEMLNL